MLLEIELDSIKELCCLKTSSWLESLLLKLS